LVLGVADLNARAGNTEKAAEIFEKLKASMPGTRYAESAALWLETKSNLPAAKAGCMGCHVGK
jgi:outer membrane protein assembly factor BamD (BamD/ComL family)